MQILVATKQKISVKLDILLIVETKITLPRWDPIESFHS